ncbi:HAMP domain-containing sensor histidine kinase [Bdellovibrionota bacterium FG-1]
MFAKIHRIIFALLLSLIGVIALYQYQILRNYERKDLQLKTQLISEFVYPFMAQGNTLDLHKAMGRLSEKVRPDYVLIINPKSRVIFSYPRVELMGVDLPVEWQAPMESAQFDRQIGRSVVIETRFPVLADQASPKGAFGTVVLGINKGESEKPIRQNIAIFVAVSLLILGCLTALITVMSQKLERAFRAFKMQISVFASGEEIPEFTAKPSDPPAWRELIQDVNKILNDYDTTKKYLTESRQVAAISAVAHQVAHDIRSPLAALDNVISSANALPEDDRILVRTAVNRIKDIANNLIDKNRELRTTKPTQGATAAPSATEPTTTQLLSSLIDPLISEKRMQFRSKIGVEIDGRIDEASYGLFAKIQPTEFKRVLSNLVNNAVEVLGERGSVALTLQSRGNDIEITVRDNGKGIPPEVLAKLGQRGETHGKEGGSGLGLFHARTSVESWGGKLKIESQVGKGTTVVVTLPRTPAPDWFVSELKLSPGASVVVLDDDSSIHGIWQGRFDSLRVSEKQITVVHVSTPDQLRTWINENAADALYALYLADYELLGFRETGLSLIEELKLGPQSILVTSRFEEKQITEGCQRLKVRLIPKGIAGFVPVKFAAPLELLDAILIDDDELVHMTWRSCAKSAQKRLKSFSTADQFFAAAETFHQSTPVYVDANLGQGIKGEEVAARIHKMGFARVYLATGYEPDQYRQYKFLAGILGKDPPF